jgi:cystathionine beta-lyase/cystathionine gamma-synthase
MTGTCCRKRRDVGGIPKIASSGVASAAPRQHSAASIFMERMMQDRDWRAETLAAQALGWVDATTQAVAPPIHMSSTFLRTPDYGNERAYIRGQNPAFDQAEALLAKLEGGAAAALFASGMAAATSVFMALKPGDHVVAPQVMYWSLRNWLTELSPANGASTSR